MSQIIINPDLDIISDFYSSAKLSLAVEFSLFGYTCIFPSMVQLSHPCPQTNQFHRNHHWGQREGFDTTDGSVILQMSSDYERWQVSLFLLLLLFMSLRNHTPRVTSPKDIHMVDLPQLSNLVFWCTVAQTIPSYSFWKNLTTSFESVQAKALHSS